MKPSTLFRTGLVLAGVGSVLAADTPVTYHDGILHVDANGICHLANRWAGADAAGAPALPPPTDHHITWELNTFQTGSAKDWKDLLSRPPMNSWDEPAFQTLTVTFNGSTVVSVHINWGD